MNFKRLGGKLQDLRGAWIAPNNGRRYRIIEIKISENGLSIVIVIEFDGGVSMPIECARWRGAMRLLSDGKPHLVGSRMGWAVEGSVERAAQDEAGNAKATAKWIVELLIKIGWVEIIVDRPLEIRMKHKVL